MVHWEASFSAPRSKQWKQKCDVFSGLLNGLKGARYLQTVSDYLKQIRWLMFDEKVFPWKN